MLSSSLGFCVTSGVQLMPSGDEFHLDLLPAEPCTLVGSNFRPCSELYGVSRGSLGQSLELLCSRDVKDVLSLQHVSNSHLFFQQREVQLLWTAKAIVTETWTYVLQRAVL